MKNNILVKAFNKSFLVVLTAIVNTLAFAQKTPPPPPPMTTHGAGGPGRPDISVDMYEGFLLLIAVTLVVSLYFYNRKRKLA